MMSTLLPGTTYHAAGFFICIVCMLHVQQGHILWIITNKDAAIRGLQSELRCYDPHLMCYLLKLSEDKRGLF